MSPQAIPTRSPADVTSHGASATRVMVIWCPDWPVAAAASMAGCPHDVPVAILDRGRVLACSATARAAGVRRGLRTRDAQSHCPELVVLPYDPVVDSRIFEPVVTCLEALTPGVQIIRPGMCAIRARGPSRFYGSETAAGDTLLRRLDVYDIPDSRVGIADGPFAAEQAARSTSWQHRTQVVEPGGSGRFLAPLPVAALEQPELADLLCRLGLRTLGAFAGLPATEVMTRFGSTGALAHRLAGGHDNRPVVARKPPPELTRSVDFEPPVEQADQAAFATKTIADDLVARLAELGLVCTTVRVEVAQESGLLVEREWLHPRWFSAADLVDRVRWQLQGSGTRGRGIHGSATQDNTTQSNAAQSNTIQSSAIQGSGTTATSDLTSPVTRVRLVPEQVDPVGAHADGLWGGGPDERVHRALSRVQSMLGHDAVASVVIGGGRGPADRQTLVPWGDRPSTDRPADLPWPGSLPAPPPATVFPAPKPALVLAEDGRPVAVSARGVLSGEPASFRVDAGEPASFRVDAGEPTASKTPAMQPVAAWAGPWPVEERWWDVDAARRVARFQIVGADGRAWLLAIQNGQWWTEASYD